jgi:hypothetical protein
MVVVVALVVISRSICIWRMSHSNPIRVAMSVRKTQYKTVYRALILNPASRPEIVRISSYMLQYAYLYDT